jgi:hemoglobin-like flavoprotein
MIPVMFAASLAPTAPTPAIPAAHLALVRGSWRALEPNGDLLAKRFHARLAATSPAARALFAETDRAEHGRKLVALLAYVVAHLDRPDELMPVVAALSRRHAAYGVAAADYAAVGEALCHAIDETLGERATPAVRAAWATTYAALAAVMRRAQAHDGLA